MVTMNGLCGINYIARLRKARFRIDAMPEDIDYEHPRGLKRRLFKSCCATDPQRQRPYHWSNRCCKPFFLPRACSLSRGLSVNITAFRHF